MPKLYIISGCNGAGKTTASYTILPEILHCNEFVNADNIAFGLSPFNQESVAFEAGRIMLRRVRELMETDVDFAIETTLSSKSYAAIIADARGKGYEITLLYFWLKSPEIAIERVAKRVRSGGHNIPAETVTRRYIRGLRNLFRIYIPICDNWLIINNMNVLSEIVVRGKRNFEKVVINEDIWRQIENASQQ